MSSARAVVTFVFLAMALAMSMGQQIKLCDLIKRQTFIDGVMVDDKTLTFAITNHLIEFSLHMFQADKLILAPGPKDDPPRITSLPYRVGKKIKFDILHSMFHIALKASDGNARAKYTCYSYNKHKLTCIEDNSSVLISSNHLIDQHSKLLLAGHNSGFRLNQTKRRLTFTSVKMRENLVFEPQSQAYALYKSNKCYLLVDASRSISKADLKAIIPLDSACEHSKSSYQPITWGRVPPNGFYTGKDVFLFTTKHVIQLTIVADLSSHSAYLVPSRSQDLHHFFGCDPPFDYTSLIIPAGIIILAIVGVLTYCYSKRKIYTPNALQPTSSSIASKLNTHKSKLTSNVESISSSNLSTKSDSSCKTLRFKTTQSNESNKIN